MDSTTQQKILEDLDRRWTDALLEEKHRERARILVLMLRQVMDGRGEIPEHHRALLRDKMNSLAKDLHRMTLLEASKSMEAIKLVGDSLPDPLSGRGFHEPLADTELVEIRAKHPPVDLRPAPPVLNEKGLNGDEDGTPAESPELPEEDVAIPEPVTVTQEGRWRSPYNPMMGPGQGWVHPPRRGSTPDARRIHLVQYGPGDCYGWVDCPSSRRVGCRDVKCCWIPILHGCGGAISELRPGIAVSGSTGSNECIDGAKLLEEVRADLASLAPAK
jgi:hypothetical protein